MNQEKLERLNELLEGERGKGKLADAGFQILYKGQNVYEKYYGQADKGSIYRIYSMTKPVTAVAAFILYERGLIDLWEPIWHFIPEFKKMRVLMGQLIVPAEREITVADLLNMTSGLVYDDGNNLAELELGQVIKDMGEEIKQGKKIDIVEACRRAAAVPLIHQPGERWHYGISADVMGAIVQIVSGMSYGQFLQQEIFKPLEMKDTGFYVEKEKSERILPIYTRVNESGQVEKSEAVDLMDFLCALNRGDTPVESGGGGLFSTVEDYSHFAQMLLHKGSYKGKQILGRKTVEFMSQNQLTEEQMKTIYFDSIFGYGYGNFMRCLNNKTVAASNGSLGEFGWDGMLGNYFMVDPQEELTFVYMQQIKQGADLSMRRRMRQIIYGAIE